MQLDTELLSFVLKVVSDLCVMMDSPDVASVGIKLLIW
jgi:hypothetical protein